MSYANQLDFLRRNMQSQNQRVLMSRPVAPETTKYLTTGSGIQMGNRPRGTSTDKTISYPNAQNPNAAYKTNAVWTHFLPWVVIWPGERHHSVNTQLIINYIKYHFYSDSYAGWQLTTYDDTLGSKHLAFISADTVNDNVIYTYDSQERKSYFSFTSNLNPIHAWKMGRVQIPDAEELKCVYVEVAATLGLIDDQDVDDRALSEYMLNIAGDYYVNDTETMSAPMMGSSRFVRVHNGLTKINFATVSPPGTEWFRNSDYKGAVSITEREFIATDPTFLPSA